MGIYSVKKNKCFQDISKELNSIYALSERVSNLERHTVIENGFLNSNGTVKWKLYADGRLVIDGNGDTGTYDNSETFTPIYDLENVNEVEVISSVGTVNAGAIAFATAEPSSLIVNCKAIGSGAFSGDWTNSIKIGKNVASIASNAFPGAGSKYNAGTVAQAPILYYDGTTNDWEGITLSDGWSNHAYFDNNQVVCSNGTVGII